MTGFERFLDEARRDWREMQAGRIPESWQLDGDEDCLVLCQRLVTLVKATRADVVAAFEAHAFNCWSEAEEEDPHAFIDNCVNHVWRGICRERQQPRLFA